MFHFFDMSKNGLFSIKNGLFGAYLFKCTKLEVLLIDLLYVYLNEAIKEIVHFLVLKDSIFVI
jgi:hypothetical protein